MGKSTTVSFGGNQNGDKSNASIIDGGEAATDNSTDIIVKSPKFVFVDDHHLKSDELFAEIDEAITKPTMFLRKSIKTGGNDNIVKTGEETTTIRNGSGPVTQDLGEKKATKKVKSNAPWDNEEILGNIIKHPLIEHIEVRYNLSSYLIKKVFSTNCVLKLIF